MDGIRLPGKPDLAGRCLGRHASSPLDLDVCREVADRPQDSAHGLGNIRVGVAFIRQLLHEFNGDPRAAIAAWYQGPTSLRKRGPYRATRLFVADVVALRERFI